MAKRASTSSNPATAGGAGTRGKRAPRRSSTLGDETAASARDIRVSHEELRRQIQETAYYKAQQRGFAPGYEHQDWVDAEAEVMQRLGIPRQ